MSSAASSHRLCSVVPAAADVWSLNPTRLAMDTAPVMNVLSTGTKAGRAAGLASSASNSRSSTRFGSSCDTQPRGITSHAHVEEADESLDVAGDDGGRQGRGRCLELGDQLAVAFAFLAQQIELALLEERLPRRG